MDEDKGLDQVTLHEYKSKYPFLDGLIDDITKKFPIYAIHQKAITKELLNKKCHECLVEPGLETNWMHYAVFEQKLYELGQQDRDKKVSLIFKNPTVESEIKNIAGSIDYIVQVHYTTQIRSRREVSTDVEINIYSPPFLEKNSE